MIDHVVLRTDNVGGMVDFYSRVLGCEVERTMPPETGLIQLRAGASLIDIVAIDSSLGRAGGGPPTRTENTMDHFCLQIESISEEKLLDWLQSVGVEHSEFAVRYGAEGFGPSVYVKDPDGNTVELRCESPTRRQTPSQSATCG
ncbi:MAG: VOC family protein [Gammaproteobacteria bacterium]|nr:VOC family protein [Gammaproteobacteria bacterium]MBT8054284.1 VOC family protein [Gammaproteobacteria bacterium]